MEKRLANPNIGPNQDVTMASCECAVCVEGQKYRALINEICEKDPALGDRVKELHEAFIETQMNRNYFRSLVNGDWPNADEVIKRKREYLRAKTKGC